MRKTVVITVLLISAVPALAADLLVPSEYPTIRDAIGAAVNGDTVIVANGVYTGTGNHFISFEGKSITVRSENGPDNCIIDCQMHFGFVFLNDEDEDSVLDGFTITGGRRGISCHEASPTIMNCVINHNSDNGILVSQGSPKIFGCRITSNTAESGAGIFIVGDGIVEVSNCLIAGNSATESGGGIYCASDDTTITNCTIVENSALSGGGIFIYAPEPVTITNTILWGNVAYDEGPQIFQVLDNGVVSYCCVQGGWPGEGNIDMNPSFAFDDSYILSAGSACIDAGTNEPFGGLADTDIEGQPRLSDGDGDGNSIVDMGVYEFPEIPFIAVSPDSMEFFIAVGDANSSEQPLQIRNSGRQTLYWQIIEDCPWLQVNPSQGQSTGQINEVLVSANASGLGVGEYSTALQIVDSNAWNSPKTVDVNLFVYQIRNVPSQYSTIQAAIDAANDYDVVVVADGIYTGVGNRDLDYHGKKITVRSANGPQNCIIDCQSSGRGFYFHSGETPLSVLAGLTITDGDELRGGGVFCENGSSPTIKNCIFDKNIAYQGGGIFIFESNPTLSNCVFRENYGHNGAGLCSWESKLTATNCTFINNSVGSFISGVINCSEFSNLTLTNCILWNDNNYDEEPGIVLQRFSRLSVNYSDVQNGEDAVRLVGDNYLEWGYGNIDTAPNLDLDGHLASSESPCINAGDPNGDYSGDTDIDGHRRVLIGRVDIGADEYAPEILVTRPEGGEVWAARSGHHINWSSFGIPSTVDILYSDNNGVDWVTIEENVANSGDYYWRLPRIHNSNQCLVSVVPSTPDANVLCVESGVFTIQHYPQRPAVPPGWNPSGQRPGKGPKELGPEIGCVNWYLETDGPVSAAATVGRNDKVHVGCEDGNLYTLDSDGSVIWTYDTNSPILASPTIGHYKMVYLGVEAGKLYAIGGNGQLIWTHNANSPIYSAPVVSSVGNIYVCSQDGILQALGPDGSELWTFETDGFGVSTGAIFATPVIGADGIIYVAGLYDPNLYAINPADGGIKWVCNFEFPVDPCDPNKGTVAGWPFASPALAPDGTIYQSLLYDTNLYAIDSDNGNIIWSVDLADPCSGWFGPDYEEEYEGSYCWSDPVFAPDGTIYVSFDDPYLRVVNPNGSIKWVTRLGDIGGFTLTVGDDGLVYAASDDNYLYVVGPDGRGISLFQGDGWLSYPVIAGHRRILISDANDKLWSISQQDCQGDYDLKGDSSGLARQTIKKGLKP